MRNIVYTLGILALLLTFSSCTIEEIEKATLQTSTDIDPPIPMPLPM